MYEHNGYGEFTGASYHLGGADIVGRAKAFGMPGEKVDGTDFFAVYEAVGKAVDRARNGGGPSAVEAKAGRFFGHFEGDPELYRTKEEIKDLQENADPIKIFIKAVTDAGQLSIDELTTIDAEILTMLDEKIEAAKAAPNPPGEALYTDVYINY
jgi:pyruvate dehydrogenase E1 component alpha subunit